MSNETFPRSGSPINGPCVVCQVGTDTGFGVQGGANGIAVALMQVGLPEAVALQMVRNMLGPDTRIPAHTITGIRVCTKCAEHLPYKTALMVGNIPVTVYDFTYVP